MTNNPILSNSNGDRGDQFYQDMMMLVEGEPAAQTVASQESLGLIKPSPTTTSNVMGEVRASPKGGGSKPIRRRLRTSKKTPVTILKANANNFRALVQQFTGCPTPPAPLSLAAHKGPVHLNFGPSTYVGQVSTIKTTTTSSNPSLLPNYGYTSNTYSSSNSITGQQQPQIHYQKSMVPTGEQDDHGLGSFNRNYYGDIIATNDDFSTNSIVLHDRLGGFGWGDYDNNTLFP